MIDQNTPAHFVPNQMRYQAAPLPDTVSLGGNCAGVDSERHGAALNGVTLSRSLSRDVPGAFRCTPTEHRCPALLFAFFDILATGTTGPATLAAVRECRA